MLDMDDIQCRVAREKSLHQAGIGTCSLAWQVGFFFDGIHRNINQDSETNRLSNVSRLYRAHPLQESMDLDSSYLFSKLYISGLGTSYEDQTAERLHSVMDSQQSALRDNALDSASSQAKEAVVDALYDANKRDWFDTLSHNLNGLLSIKTAKAVISDTAQHIAKTVTLEALPALRDHPVVMELFMTGVDARVDGAKNSFKKQFASLKAENQLPIKLIQVSVFGADLGGMLARRFIDELLEAVCSKEGDEYRYEGIKVEVIFAGLFDCSRRSALDIGDTMADTFSLAGLLARPIAGPLEWIGGPKVIDFNKQLHPAVKKALHLVAAHERRVYRPLVPLGPLTPEWREVLLPGISEDITGGLQPNEQRPSAELCRVALHEMYCAACKGEVPFPNFNTLQEIDPLVAAYFEMNDNLAGKSVRYYTQCYMQMAGNMTPSSNAFGHHLEIYAEWLGRQYADYKARIEKANAEERSWLKERWGWLGFVYDEATYIERAVTNPNGYIAYAKGSNAIKMAKIFLYPPLRAFPEDVANFFAYFMHDFVSSTAFVSSPVEHAKLTAQSETLISSHHFFMSRGMEAITLSKNKVDTESLIKSVRSDQFVIDYEITPTGKCFDSANRVGELVARLAPLAKISYRLVQLTTNSDDINEVNIKNNYNHMVVVLNDGDGVIVFDPTMSQFPNIDSPFYGSESEWLGIVRDKCVGRIVKAAIKYRDFPSHRAANNASISARIDFISYDGVWINQPDWYVSLLKKIDLDSVKPKKKTSCFFSCMGR